MLAESYINEEQNFDSTILKGTVEKGTKWRSNNLNFEITDVNVRIETPVNTFKTIEVTCKKGIKKSKIYYARRIGVVRSESKDGFSELIELDYDVKK